MIGFFEHQYLRYKKQHLKNLVALAFIDGELHAKERTMLYTIGERYGLKGWQIARIIENNGSIELDMPDDINQRLDQMYDLIAMMLADDIIDTAEMQLCQQVSSNFGFKVELVPQLITMIYEGNTSKLQWNKFKSEKAAEFIA